MSLISGLINQTITSIYSITENKYSDEVATLIYSNVPCRWEERINKIVSNIGSDKVSKIETWILPTYSNIDYNYKIVKSSSNYYIIGIDKVYDLSGQLDHIKLYLG